MVSTQTYLMARTIRLVLIAGALFVAPLNAAGEGDPKAQAVKLLREGNRLFQSGDHEGALTSYRKAKAAFPSYKLEFNMARSLEALRRPAQAAESYERFLAGAEKSQDSANISAARGKVGMLRTSLASLTLKGGSGRCRGGRGEAAGGHGPPRPPDLPAARGQ